MDSRAAPFALLLAPLWAGLLVGSSSAAGPTEQTPPPVATHGRVEPGEAGPDGSIELCPFDELAREVGGSLAELRGRPFERTPQVRCVGSEVLSRRLRADLPVPDTARAAARELAVKLLGMLPADYDLGRTLDRLHEDQLSAFYDAAANTLYMLDEIGPGVGRMVLAGELARVLHEQAYQLSRMDEALAHDHDAQLALRALVEGSELALTVMWVKANPRDINLHEVIALQDSLSTGALESAPPFVWKPLVALSARGDTFLRRTSRVTPLAGPTRVADIDQAFASPPLSTEQILHPVKYWKSERRDDPWRITLDTSRVPEGWSVVYEDTLGELYLSILTEPFAERRGMTHSPFDLGGLPYTNDAASGWGGDRVILLEKDGAYLLRLFTVWDTTDDADEFAWALASLESDIRAEQDALEGFRDAPRGLRIEHTGGRRVLLSAWLGIEAGEARRVASSLSSVEAR